MVKLAVGVRDVAHLTAIQRHRIDHDPPLRHQTRSFPKRAAELADGGSIYWVIAGAILVRQCILEVRADRWDNGADCAGLVLDPQLVAVSARPTRPFQGWRYLAADAAPSDLDRRTVAQDLPEHLRRDLATLGLL